MAEDSKGAVILIAENELIAADLAQCLEDSGYEASDILTSTAGALERIERSRVDVVMIDLAMRSEPDAFDVGDEIRRRTGLPVVYVIDNDERLAQVLRKKGAQHYIPWPFEPWRLEGALETALGSLGDLLVEEATG